MNTPSHNVNLSTLETILQDTIQGLHDETKPGAKLNDFRFPIVKLRVEFLEPLLRQIISDYPSIILALREKESKSKNFKFTYVQQVYTVLNLPQKEAELIKWIKTFRKGRIPKYREHKHLYQAVKFINQVVHQRSSNEFYNQKEFCQVYYWCLALYKLLFPLERVLYFHNAEVVDEHISDRLYERMKAERWAVREAKLDKDILEMYRNKESKRRSILSTVLVVILCLLYLIQCAYFFIHSIKQYPPDEPLIAI